MSGPPDGPSYELENDGAHDAILTPVFHASGTGQLTSAFWLAFLMVFFFHILDIVLTEYFLSQYPLKWWWRTISVWAFASIRLLWAPARSFSLIYRYTDLYGRYGRYDWLVTCNELIAKCLSLYSDYVVLIL